MALGWGQDSGHNWAGWAGLKETTPGPSCKGFQSVPRRVTCGYTWSFTLESCLVNAQLPPAAPTCSFERSSLQP